MKNIAIIIFTLLSLGVSAQKNIYTSEKFDELSQDHNNLAIIPFLTNLELKDEISSKELKDLEQKEGYAVQDALETYFSKRKKKKKFSVEFQNIKNTNAILKQNGISYDNIDVYSVKELAQILGVNGIISGTLDLNVLLSKGVPTEFSLLDYINGDSNYGRIGVKISDGITGKLLWKYEKQINKKSGKNTTDLIDLMMKLASRKFPYDRERPRDRKKS
ncbi:hypothetical protein [Arenibacter sp. ARW7G5Y1]|uniref:hypothetical protein n=1 Tax=Arenibacter sp. ARW7G5Y1 TaxID=2135619 RepID=UPI000D76466F|nr:hypothetical protein [Arenibacter sp. ARW7G5Y1]PXX23044.1 hypothetical protein C7972_12132 [Arenibacter sp. ARW7G5Y1]|tara:strand:- start:7961 stop:8614 length:654 start_codon:yes stop_codon:yes gene_type:complete